MVASTLARNLPNCGGAAKEPGDLEIKKAFEIADDAMQGVIGYFLYVSACQKLARSSEIVKELPPDKFQITHEWVRQYDPMDLCRIIESCFLYYHARTTLISTIGVFEGALKNFAQRLVETGSIPKPKKDNYEARLQWAFKIAMDSTFGRSSMKERIPDICLEVDHARRIRNLWMHNNGLINESYGKGITVNGHQPIIVREYNEILKNRKKGIPFILNPDAFARFSFSHIELLHHVHDTIQRKYFGQKISYDYGMQQKKIEWHRLLGVS